MAVYRQSCVSNGRADCRAVGAIGNAELRGNEVQLSKLQAEEISGADFGDEERSAALIENHACRSNKAGRDNAGCSRR
jgi:hypothetical protein